MDREDLLRLAQQYVASEVEVDGREIVVRLLADREALEEIRQRVADGWVPSYEGLCWQHDEELCDPVGIKPEVASLLWSEDPTDA
jgi:hypothetical protein